MNALKSRSRFASTARSSSQLVEEDRRIQFLEEEYYRKIPRAAESYIEHLFLKTVKARTTSELKLTQDEEEPNIRDSDKLFIEKIKK